MSSMTAMEGLEMVKPRRLTRRRDQGREERMEISLRLREEEEWEGDDVGGSTGIDETQANVSGTRPMNMDSIGKGKAPMDTGTSQLNDDAGIHSTQSTTILADKEKDKENTFGRWTTVERYTNKGRKPVQARRSSGEEPRKTIVSSRFASLQEQPAVTVDVTTEPKAHVSNGQTSEPVGDVGDKHVAPPRHSLKNAGRGGRSSTTRGGMPNRGSNGSQCGPGSQKEMVRWEHEKVHTQRQAPARRGSGGHASTVLSSRTLSTWRATSDELQEDDWEDGEVENPPLRLMSSIDRLEFEKRNEPNNPLALVPRSSKYHFDLVDKIT
ncbi:hypothetical protein J5N97_003783 [Dioscorea zingiberensis]|uniref:Uncharacterized protein n=1 Tax=Dioscorea zingiberensis TaxID=325984 RepID=A0A9D5HRI4_9LILI|nr:hypothetical protein J5N97_003783 [Dioscorea zingiberensis]